MEPREDLREAAQQLLEEMYRAVGMPMTPLGYLHLQLCMKLGDGNEAAFLEWLTTPLPDGTLPIHDAWHWSAEDIDEVFKELPPPEEELSGSA